MNSRWKSKIISGFIWRFLERCGAKGVSFLVSLILAILLDPDVYGVVAIVLVVSNIMQVFIDGGLGNALIQKKNADSIDFSTVFYFNVFSSFVLYGLIFASAPLVSYFFNKLPELTELIRALSLSVLISGVKNVQQAYVSRNLLFKKFFFSTLGGTLAAAVIGIVMAVLGFGVWALIAQYLINNLVDTLILWITVKWRPTYEFSFSRLKSLLSYGWKILLSNLIDTLYTELRTIVIGKIYSSSDLGYFNRGIQAPYMVVTTVNSSLDSVLLPTMSAVQDDIVRIKGMTRKAIKVSSYVIFPLMMGMAGCSKVMVHLVLRDKWMPCVPYLIMFCIAYMFHPIQTANLNAIKAIGRSDVYMRVEIWKKIVGVVALACTMYISVMALGYSMIFIAFAAQVISGMPCKKLFNYTYREQVVDILPCGLLSVLMGIVVYSFAAFDLPDAITLLIQVTFGVIFYIFGSRLLKIDSFDYLLGLIKRKS